MNRGAWQATVHGVAKSDMTQWLHSNAYVCYTELWQTKPALRITETAIQANPAGQVASTGSEGCPQALTLTSLTTLAMSSLFWAVRSGAIFTRTAGLWAAFRASLSCSTYSNMGQRWGPWASSLQCDRDLRPQTVRLHPAVKLRHQQFLLHRKHHSQLCKQPHQDRSDSIVLNQGIPKSESLTSLALAKTLRLI